MSDIKIRLSVYEDVHYLKQWLKEPGILEWFPMCDDREIEDAARLWISYVKYGAVLTALFCGKPCGIINLYLQTSKKLAHQSLFAIVVQSEYRGKGIGTKLIEEITLLGKNKFHLKYLHLEVYENNPAIALYERLGFKKFGAQKNFIKKLDGTYLSKIFMQKNL